LSAYWTITEALSMCQTNETVAAISAFMEMM
jgi:hypothetical protein